MNLQNLNVTELSAQEVQETDGGINWGMFWRGVGIGLGVGGSVYIEKEYLAA